MTELKRQRGGVLMTELKRQLAWCAVAGFCLYIAFPHETLVRFSALSLGIIALIRGWSPKS